MGTFLPGKLYTPSFLKAGQYAAKSGGAFSQGVLFTPVFFQSTQYAAQAGGAFPDGKMFTPAFMQSVTYNKTLQPGAFENAKKIKLYGVETDGVPTRVINDNDPLTGLPRVRTFYQSMFIRKGTNIDFTVDKRFGYEPLSCQFTDLSEPRADEWLWSFGDGFTSTEENPFHIYQHYGYYNVTMIVRVDGVYYTIRKTI